MVKSMIFFNGSLIFVVAFILLDGYSNINTTEINFISASKEHFYLITLNFKIEIANLAPKTG